jgi:hypothetical protein
VVPALTVTGELTVEPFAGVQIVTEGEAAFRVHGAAAADAEIMRRKPHSCALRSIVFASLELPERRLKFPMLSSRDAVETSWML